MLGFMACVLPLSHTSHCCMELSIATTPGNFWLHPLQALIDKLRARLAPEAFARFKQQTAEFLHGQLTPAELHASAVRLELAALAPELAALCPDAERRAGLLQAHTDTFAEGGSTEVRCGSVCHRP